MSPTLTPSLAALAAARRLQHRARPFRRADVHGCVFVVAATGRAGVDRTVARTARAARALVNVVDRPGLCDLIVPSVLRRGELQTAVSTGGRSPALARGIRRWLEPVSGPECAEEVARAGRERTRGRTAVSTAAARTRAGERAARRALVGLRLA